LRTLSWFVILQCSISGGLVALLWLLHARLGRRPFFKWWAWAWTMLALHLAIGALALPPSVERTATVAVALYVATLCGYLQPLLLTFGAVSLQSHAQPSTRWRAAGLALTAAAATTAFLLSLGLTNAIDSLCMRLAPRAWALAAASLVSAVVFARHARDSHSFAGHSTRGIGLSGEQIGRLFEPFYTTKPNGMGLGLWICEMILQAHGARVSVERNAGPGVTLVVRLPVAAASEGVSLATVGTSTASQASAAAESARAVPPGSNRPG
jgi:hypothetical protein